jgi:AcrR family transcriptional regulator
VTTTQPARRRYDSELRRQRAAQTRDRIVTAGAELVRESSVRDWRGVTIRAVAERAGVNERTVYRHFANERALRDAVMHRLEQDVGIDLARFRLEDVADATARILQHVSEYPLGLHHPLDPTLVDANRRRVDALRSAVAARASEWPVADQTLAAAMLDVLWSVAAYERLVIDWQLDRDEAIRAVTWVIGLVEGAVREGRRPGSAPTRRRGRATS